MTYEEKIGKLIKEKRIQKKYTLRGLAKELRVAYQHIQAWEKGDFLPSLKHLIKICKILDLHIADFDF